VTHCIGLDKKGLIAYHRPSDSATKLDN
jgi:hypothetical protein